MTAVIRADTDQLRAVARQMRETADLILSSTGAVAREMDSFAATWSGSARERGMARWAEIQPRYQPDAERLSHLARELDALAERLDEAARVFGDGLDVKVAVDPHAQFQAEPFPTNQFQMFEKIRGEPEIKVFRVGDNEYFVTIDGTKGWLAGANTWPNAIASGLGFGTVYTKLLKEALRRLPDGANVHLFGYSQGGLVAQNIALEQRFFSKQKLNLASVNTFGTPHELARANGVTYNTFDAEGDLVSGLGIPGLVPTEESILSIDLFRGVSEGIKIHSNAYTDPNSDVAQQMLNSGLPFTPDRWEQIPEFSVDDANIALLDTNLALITEQLSKPVEETIHLYNEATRVVENVVEEGAELVGKGTDMFVGIGKRVVDFVF